METGLLKDDIPNAEMFVDGAGSELEDGPKTEVSVVF